MKRCSQCSAFNKSNQLTCSKCGSELSESGFQADLLTYWDEQTGGRLTVVKMNGLMGFAFQAFAGFMEEDKLGGHPAGYARFDSA